ncbi:MAG: type II 3-dehydroquinate dehydratase [Bacilli bacterium]
MNILIINGANLNMLEYRSEIYGNISYENMCKEIYDFYSGIEIYHSNYEGDIIEKIHQSLDEFDAIIINPGAFTHYSYAIRDALELFGKPVIEVHLTNINEREDFRKISVIRDVCKQSYVGFGIEGYFKAINYLNANNY